MMRMRAAAGGMMVLCVAAVGSAQSSAPALKTMVADLSSESFARRTAATEALVAATNIDSVDLVNELRSGGLDAEANARVLEVLRQRFFASTRAAMGIEFEPDRATTQLPAGAPRIKMVYPTLPAGRSGLLQPGDEIIEVEGEPVENRFRPSGVDMVKAAVFSRIPGESIRVKIRRPVQPPLLDGAGNLALDPGGATTIIDTVIPLGRYDQLAEAYKQRQGEQFGALNAGGAVVIQQLEPGVPPRIVGGVQGGPAATPQTAELAMAWEHFLRRTGASTAQRSLQGEDAAAIDWTKWGPDGHGGRTMIRGGGRMLAGPIDIGRAAANMLRDQADIGRNQLILRNLAGQNGAIVRVDELDRNPNRRLLQFGEGDNQVEFRIMGDIDGDRRTRPGRQQLVPEDQFQSMCQDMADDIARIEAELGRLSKERGLASGDISTVQLVDERIAELRAEWIRLREEAAKLAAATQPEPPKEPTAFQ